MTPRGAYEAGKCYGELIMPGENYRRLVSIHSPLSLVGIVPGYHPGSIFAFRRIPFFLGVSNPWATGPI